MGDGRALKFSPLPTKDQEYIARTGNVLVRRVGQSTYIPNLCDQHLRYNHIRDGDRYA